jgi:hypothetical protein
MLPAVACHFPQLPSHYTFFFAFFIFWNVVRCMAPFSREADFFSSPLAMGAGRASLIRAVWKCRWTFDVCWFACFPLAEDGFLPRRAVWAGANSRHYACHAT